MDWRRWEKLPLTPLHYPVAYILYRLDKRLNFPALIVGNFFPDLLLPVLYFLTRSRTYGRFILHSLFGAATLGTLLAVGFTVLIYPRFVSYLFRFDKKKIKERCQLSSTLVFSCLLGNISHALLDVTNHEYNPLFWPFLPADASFSPICPLLGCCHHASLIVSSVLLVLLAAVSIRAYFRRDFWWHLLVGEANSL